MKKLFVFSLLSAAMIMTAVPCKAQTDTDLIQFKKVITEKEGVKDTVNKIVRNYPCGVPVLSKDKNNPEKASFFSYTPGTGLGLGFVAALNAPADMDTKMGRSIEIDWNLINLGYTFNNYNSVGVGFGLLWRNYRMINDKRFMLGEDQIVSVRDYEEGQQSKWSRLHSLAINVPLLYTHAWKKGWHVAAGAEFAFNCLKAKRYSVRTRYSEGDTEYIERQNNVKFNPVNINLIGIVGYRNLAFYMRYSPNDVLDTNYGPSFKSLSVGLRLNHIGAKLSRKTK